MTTLLEKNHSKARQVDYIYCIDVVNRKVVSLAIEYSNYWTIWAQYIGMLWWTFLHVHKSIQLTLTPTSLAALVIFVRVVAQ